MLSPACVLLHYAHPFPGIPSPLVLLVNAYLLPQTLLEQHHTCEFFPNLLPHSPHGNNPLLV